MRYSEMRLILAAFSLFLASCGRSESDSAAGGRDASMDGATHAMPDTPFVDVTADSGLAFQVGFTRPYLIRNQRAVTESTFGGIAAGDCDGDDDVDLFITYGNTGGPDGGGGPNRLYLNQLKEQGEGLKFVDIAEEAGVANTRADGKGNDRHSGPTFADMDGDGDLDLYLGGLHGDPNKIFANDGSCHFTDVTANSPDIVNMLATNTISAGFGDYDLDGDLDMFLTHWATSDLIYRGEGGERTQETDHLFRNDSDAAGIRFVNVSEASGMSKLTWLTRDFDFYGRPQDADFTFTATFARINDDVWPDIALASDFGTTQLALNSGDGTFRSLDNAVLRRAQFGMGSALGDIDNDGDLDWFITSIEGPSDGVIPPWGNRFYLNDGTANRFVDISDALGIASGSWGWAACLVDIDNDSDLDIYHTNGWSEPFLVPEEDYKAPPDRLFVMNAAGTYTDEAEAFGLGDPVSSRSAVCADFDQDGDIDLLEMTNLKPNSARLWENKSAAAGNHSLRIKLEGLPPNTQAAGARIHVTVGQKRQMHEVTIGSNFASQNPTVQVFGLGEATAADEILVEWPAIKGAGPQIGTLLSGPFPASEPGQTIVIRHPELPAP